MKKLMFILAFVLPYFAPAQTPSKYSRLYSDSLPAGFQLSASRLREHIYNGIPNFVRKELTPRACFRFADQAAVQLSYFFASGQVYSDWPLFEEYVNQVLRKVTPPELYQDSVIHAYLVKDGNFNASMSPFGIMFVQIGLFDEIHSEAGLAGILTHELAHYYLRHSLYRFVKAEKRAFTRLFGRTSASRFSIENEMQADSLALVWMNRSGYGFNGFYEGIKAIQRLEERALLRLENVWELKETTHPVSERRLAQIDSFDRTHRTAASMDFVVSKKLFFMFREHAKVEALKYLLYDFNYDACIEKAFKFHILNPKKPEYVYYLLEGIRRKCYFNVDYWKKQFIIDNYYKIVETKLGRRKEKHEGNIFKQNPKTFFGLSAEEEQMMGGKFYWEGVEKFESYEEAFNFFNQTSELYNDPEFLLSNALSFSSESPSRDTLLTQYLSHSNIKYREYAKRMLDRTILTSLPDKNLTMLSDFFATVRQGKDEIFIRNEKLMDNSNDVAPLATKAVADFGNRRFLNLSDLQQNNMHDYMLLQELKKLTLISFVAKGERTELHILDPRYWEIMNRYGVNEVEFIDFIYYDDRKPEDSLESYKEIIDSNVGALLSEVKRNRYLEARIAVGRMKPGGLMRFVHYEPEIKVDFNKPAADSIVEYFRDSLKAKDKDAEKRDARGY